MRARGEEEKGKEKGRKGGRERRHKKREAEGVAQAVAVGATMVIGRRKKRGKKEKEK